MAKCELPKSTTSKLAYVYVKNASTGAPLTGLVYNTSGLQAYYHREGDSTSTAISLASATVGTWTSGGFKEIDSTNLPGLYEIGIPNACFSSGNSFRLVYQGATNMYCNPLEYETTSVSNQDGVRGGMTALPNAVASASGGLPTYGSGTGQINPASGTFTSVGLAATQTGVTIPTVTTVTNQLSAATIAAAVWNVLTSTLTTASSVGLALANWFTNGVTIASGQSVASVTGAVGSVTGNVGGSVASVTGSVGSVTGSVGSISGITFPSNFGTFSIDSSGRVTLTPTNNALIATDVAADILVTPSNLLTTDSSGRVTLVPADVPPSTAAIATAVAAAVPTDTTIQADVVTSLVAQGYTTTRAGYLDVLNGIVTSIWGAATRTLSAFGFGVTVTTNNDKTGYSLSTSDRTSATLNNLTQGSAGTQQFTAEALELAPSSGDGFSGPDQVTFSFLSSIGAPIPYVQFAVVDVGLATTNAEGVITLGLNAGSYSVVAAPNSGVMWASQAFTVSGSTTVDVTGTAVPAPAAPTDPTLCTPYVYLWPEVAGVSATLQLLNLPQNVQSLWLGPIVSIETSNSSGLITFANFPIGSQVRLTIPDRGVARQYILSEGSQELSL